MLDELDLDDDGQTAVWAQRRQAKSGEASVLYRRCVHARASVTRESSPLRGRLNDVLRIYM